MARKNWKNTSSLPSPRLIPEWKDLKSILEDTCKTREDNDETMIILSDWPQTLYHEYYYLENKLSVYFYCLDANYFIAFNWIEQFEKQPQAILWIQEKGEENRRMVKKMKFLMRNEVPPIIAMAHAGSYGLLIAYCEDMRLRLFGDHSQAFVALGTVPCHFSITCLCFDSGTGVLFSGTMGAVVAWFIRANGQGLQVAEKMSLSDPEFIQDLSLDTSLGFLMAVCESVVRLFTHEGQGHLKEVKTFAAHSTGFSLACCCACEPQNTFYAGNKKGEVLAWRLDDSDFLHSFKAHSSPVICVYSRPETYTLFTAGGEGTVKEWNLASGNLLRQVNIGTNLQHVQFMDSSSFYCQTAFTFSLYHLPYFYRVFNVCGSAPQKVQRVLCGHNWARILCATEDGLLRFLSPVTGDLLIVTWPLLAMDKAVAWAYHVEREELFVSVGSSELLVFDTSQSPCTAKYLLCTSENYRDKVRCLVYTNFFLGETEKALMLCGHDSGTVRILSQYSSRRAEKVIHAGPVLFLCAPEGFEEGPVVCSYGKDDYLNLLKVVPLGKDLTLEPVSKIFCVHSLKHVVLLPGSVGAITEHSCWCLWRYQDVEESDPNQDFTLKETNCLHDCAITSFDVCLNLRLFVTGAVDGSVRVWDFRGRLLTQFDSKLRFGSPCFANNRGDLLLTFNESIYIVSCLKLLHPSRLERLGMLNIGDELQETPKPFLPSFFYLFEVIFVPKFMYLDQSVRELQGLETLINKRAIAFDDTVPHVVELGKHIITHQRSGRYYLGELYADFYTPSAKPKYHHATPAQLHVPGWDGLNVYRMFRTYFGKGQKWPFAPDCYIPNSAIRTRLWPDGTPVFLRYDLCPQQGDMEDVGQLRSRSPSSESLEEVAVRKSKRRDIYQEQKRQSYSILQKITSKGWKGRKFSADVVENIVETILNLTVFCSVEKYKNYFSALVEIFANHDIPTKLRIETACRLLKDITHYNPEIRGLAWDVLEKLGFLSNAFILPLTMGLMDSEKAVRTKVLYLMSRYTGIQSKAMLMHKLRRLDTIQEMQSDALGDFFLGQLLRIHASDMDTLIEHIKERLKEDLTLSSKDVSLSFSFESLTYEDIERIAEPLVESVPLVESQKTDGLKRKRKRFQDRAKKIVRKTLKVSKRTKFVEELRPFSATAGEPRRFRKLMQAYTQDASLLPELHFSSDKTHKGTQEVKQAWAIQRATKKDMILKHKRWINFKNLWKQAPRLKPKAAEEEIHKKAPLPEQLEKDTTEKAKEGDLPTSEITISPSGMKRDLDEEVEDLAERAFTGQLSWTVLPEGGVSPAAGGALPAGELWPAGGASPAGEVSPAALSERALEEEMTATDYEDISMKEMTDSLAKKKPKARARKAGKQKGEIVEDEEELIELEEEEGLIKPKRKKKLIKPGKTKKEKKKLITDEEEPTQPDATAAQDKETPAASGEEQLLQEEMRLTRKKKKERRKPKQKLIMDVKQRMLSVARQKKKMKLREKRGELSQEERKRMWVSERTKEKEERGWKLKTLRKKEGSSEEESKETLKKKLREQRLAQRRAWSAEEEKLGRLVGKKEEHEQEKLELGQDWKKEEEAKERKRLVQKREKLDLEERKQFEEMRKVMAEGTPTLEQRKAHPEERRTQERPQITEGKRRVSLGKEKMKLVEGEGKEEKEEEEMKEEEKEEEEERKEARKQKEAAEEEKKRRLEEERLGEKLPQKVEEPGKMIPQQRKESVRISKMKAIQEKLAAEKKEHEEKDLLLILKGEKVIKKEGKVETKEREKPDEKERLWREKEESQFQEKGKGTKPKKQLVQEEEEAMLIKEGRQVGEPKSQVGEPKSQVGKPKSQVGKPKSQVGEPKSQVGKPKSQVGEPKSQVGEPKSLFQKKEKRILTPEDREKRHTEKEEMDKAKARKRMREKKKTPIDEEAMKVEGKMFQEARKLLKQDADAKFSEKLLREQAVKKREQAVKKQAMESSVRLEEMDADAKKKLVLKEKQLLKILAKMLRDRGLSPSEVTLPGEGPPDMRIYGHKFKSFKKLEEARKQPEKKEDSRLLQKNQEKVFLGRDLVEMLLDKLQEEGLLTKEQLKQLSRHLDEGPEEKIQLKKLLENVREQLFQEWVEEKKEGGLTYPERAGLPMEEKEKESLDKSKEEEEAVPKKKKRGPLKKKVSLSEEDLEKMMEEQRKRRMILKWLKGKNLAKKKRKPDAQESPSEEEEEYLIQEELESLGKEDKASKEEKGILSVDEESLSKESLESEERPVEERPRKERPRKERPRKGRPVEERPRKERPVEEKTRKERLMEERPRKGRPVEERPRKERPVEEKTKKERLMEERPRKERSVEERPGKKRPEEEKPVEERRRKEKLVEERQRKERPVEERPIEERRRKERPVEERPRKKRQMEERRKKKRPMEESSSEESSSKESLSEESLSEESSSEESWSEERPSEERPSEERPRKERPRKERRRKERPVEERPTEERPTEERPIEERPIEERPGKEIPVEERPIEEGPVEERPIEERPGKEIPVEERPIEEGPVEERPIEEIPVEERPIEEGPVEERPIEEIPVEERPIEEIPVEERPIEEIPVEERPIEERPGKEIPVEERPRKERLMEERPIEERPRKERPRKERPRKEKPMEERPVEERPRKERPVEERPRKEKLIREKSRKERPVEERPRKERPVEERPRKERPVEERPRKERPVEERPRKERPVEERPRKERPVEERPRKERPVEERPRKERPIEDRRRKERSVEERPGKERPMEERPIEERPTEERPTEERPTEERPTEERPTEERPTEERPTEERPTEERPTEERPTEERPIEERPTEERSTEERPTEERPTEERPTEERPRKERLVEERRRKERPVEGRPIEERPVEERRRKERPMEERQRKERPLEERRRKERPIEERPVEESPVEERPIEERRRKERPMEKRPRKERPVEERPIEERPVEERPIEERPVEERPIEERRRKERSMEERPGKERPGKERPGKERPRKERQRKERPMEEALVLGEGQRLSKRLRLSKEALDLSEEESLREKEQRKKEKREKEEKKLKETLPLIKARVLKSEAASSESETEVKDLAEEMDTTTGWQIGLEKAGLPVEGREYGFTDKSHLLPPKTSLGGKFLREFKKRWDSRFAELLPSPGGKAVPEAPEAGLDTQIQEQPRRPQLELPITLEKPKGKVWKWVVRKPPAGQLKEGGAQAVPPAPASSPETVKSPASWETSSPDEGWLDDVLRSVEAKTQLSTESFQLLQELLRAFEPSSDWEGLQLSYLKVIAQRLESALGSSQPAKVTSPVKRKEEGRQRSPWVPEPIGMSATRTQRLDALAKAYREKPPPQLSGAIKGAEYPSPAGRDALRGAYSSLALMLRDSPGSRRRGEIPTSPKATKTFPVPGPVSPPVLSKTAGSKAIDWQLFDEPHRRAREQQLWDVLGEIEMRQFYPTQRHILTGDHEPIHRQTLALLFQKELKAFQRKSRHPRLPKLETTKAAPPKREALPAWETFVALYHVLRMLQQRHAEDTAAWMENFYQLMDLYQVKSPRIQRLLLDLLLTQVPQAQEIVSEKTLKAVELVPGERLLYRLFFGGSQDRTGSLRLWGVIPLSGQNKVATIEPVGIAQYGFLELAWKNFPQVSSYLEKMLPSISPHSH